MTKPTISIISDGGQCPYQIEGRLGGKYYFYFRSRGTRWSVSIMDSKVLNFDREIWYYSEHYGEWPSAGWITCEEAHLFMNKALEMFLDGVPSQPMG